MKLTSLTLLAALTGPVLLMVSPPSARAAEDLRQVYRTGRNAFNRGDMVTAKAAFARLLRADPDFELGKIYMAQIRYAEALREARPLSVKIVEKTRVGPILFSAIPLSEALELVRREVEKAGSGPTAGTIELITDLPAGALARPVSLSVSDVPMQWWIDAVAYAGNVRITLTRKGLSVTAIPDSPPAPDRETAEAALKMRQRARDRILERVKMDKAPLPQVLNWLRQRTDPSLGPLIVARGSVPSAPVTLDLRNIPLSEAIRYVALVTDLEVDWRDWGAGLRPAAGTQVTAPGAAPDARPAL